VLALRDGQWALLGGGGASSDEDLLADRPAVLPGYLTVGRDAVSAEPPVIVVSGTGLNMNHRGWSLRMTAAERWVKCSSPDALSLFTVAPCGTPLC